MYKESNQRKRILFIGLKQSSHTHAWMNLISGSEYDIKLFPVNNNLIEMSGGNEKSKDWVKRKIKWQLKAIKNPQIITAKSSLAHMIRNWKPDIIHTFGILPASKFYMTVREKYDLSRNCKWVLQTRGGSDLALSRFKPQEYLEIQSLFKACDQILSDNPFNYEIALQMGVRENQISKIGTVPGTGGIDIERLRKARTESPSSQRTILWPKAYECPWSKALPVFEALKLCWDDIQPCSINMLAMNKESKMWYNALPESIRRHCLPQSRIPRETLLELMSKSRVMLAPSLVDGTPNTLFEAMAAGATPIVSPLETIKPIVSQNDNVLFARNLYPEEIALAITRAMTSDILVDKIARNNFRSVKNLADRRSIRRRVIQWYDELSKMM